MLTGSTFQSACSKFASEQKLVLAMTDQICSGTHHESGCHQSSAMAYADGRRQFLDETKIAPLAFGKQRVKIDFVEKSQQPQLRNFDMFLEVKYSIAPGGERGLFGYCLAWIYSAIQGQRTNAALVFVLIKERTSIVIAFYLVGRPYEEHVCECWHAASSWLTGYIEDGGSTWQLAGAMCNFSPIFSQLGTWG